MSDFRSFGAGVAGTFNQVSYGDDNGAGSARPQVPSPCNSRASSYSTLCSTPPLLNPPFRALMPLRPAPRVPLLCVVVFSAQSCGQARLHLILNPNSHIYFPQFNVLCSSHRLLPPPPVAQVTSLP
jgi:hypothetical protein